ncbi:MAG: hypothetical protein Q9222_006521 [Ikaeria aurantiellina]
MATNVDAKLLKQTKFPPEFNQKVDMKKVNVEVMKKLTRRKVLKRPSAEKSKKGRKRETSTTSASESALSGEEVVGEVTDNVTITTGGLRETQGLRLLAAVHHHIGRTIARPHTVIL